MVLGKMKETAEAYLGKKVCIFSLNNVYFRIENKQGIPGKPGMMQKSCNQEITWNYA